MNTSSKFHPTLAGMLSTRTEASGPVPVIVQYKPGTHAETVQGLERGGETRYVYSLIPATALNLSNEEVQKLASQDNVVAIWYDEIVYTCLNVTVPIIEAPKVWEAGFKGKGVKIGIVDTGVDDTHPDLLGRVVLTKDFSGEGYKDNNGHGTHVASTVAGNGSASNGNYVGVAPEASILAAKVLKGDGSGRMSDVIAGVEWALEQGAQVINLSLGSSGSSDGQDALSVACNAAVDHGVVMCVAAGNDGPAASTVGAPGAAEKAITVGATSDTSPDFSGITDFSSRGPTADGRIKPDIAFPGLNVTAARATGTAMGRPVDNFYTTASGTSMATPHCTGSVALLLQANPGMKPADVKDRIMKTARTIAELAPTVQGQGRGDAYYAFINKKGPNLPQSTPTPPPPPEPPPSGGIGCPLTGIFILALGILVSGMVFGSSMWGTKTKRRSKG
ncbi:MAG: S8 family peptidase [Chloroflexi bacterium]|nr:S8 family peptidase [Chloroflexota bacterium]